MHLIILKVVQMRHRHNNEIYKIKWQKKNQVWPRYVINNCTQNIPGFYITTEE